LRWRSPSCLFWRSFICSRVVVSLTKTAPTAIYTLSLHDALPIFLNLEVDLVGEACQFRPPLGDLRPGLVHRTAATGVPHRQVDRSEEHTSELQSQSNLVCRLLLEKKNKIKQHTNSNQHKHHIICT